jgi:hypothetical protein
MYNSMDISTTKRMTTSFYSHIRRCSKEFLHIIRTTQGNYKLGRDAVEFVITFTIESENPKIDTTMRLVRDSIFEEPEVDIVTTYQN